MVFSRAQEVALICNGTEHARVRAGTATLPDLPLSFVFELSYTPGKLEAVSYQNGREVSCDALETAGAPAALRLVAEGALRADATARPVYRSRLWILPAGWYPVPPPN